jgi:nicotinamide mononucleotide transporter
MMIALLEALTRPLLHVGTFPFSLGDLLGFATGLACVGLAARGSILNFPLGLANSAVLALVFFKSRLFGDMALQGIFFVLTSIGWAQWQRAGQGSGKPPRPSTRGDFLYGLVAVAALTLALRPLLLHLGGAAPWPDAFITSASLWAQWLLNRKSLSTWPWWIAVDVVSIPLYLSRDLPLIAFLYAIFLALCVKGWFTWRRALGT